MIVLLIGNKLDYLKKVATALHLRDDEVIFAQTRTELEKIELKKVRIVLIDLFWLYESRNIANIGSAIKWLREKGYTGTIEACANNPHSNINIVKELGNSSVWEVPEAREYPDLSTKEVSEKLAPLLA